MESHLSTPERNAEDGSWVRVRGALNFPHQEAEDLKDEEEWKQVPSQRGGSIPFWHASPSQVPLQNRCEAVELDDITSPWSLPHGRCGAGVVRQRRKERKEKE